MPVSPAFDNGSGSFDPGRDANDQPTQALPEPACPICTHHPDLHNAEGCSVPDGDGTCSCTDTTFSLSLDRYRYLFR
jgi:hypothetical protein